jgi:phosphoribosylaminoimidazole carboxylase PurE protein
MVDLRVVSAHKNGEAIAPMLEQYNNSLEPGCLIAVAGRSNGLGGALSANSNLPVINCPPFRNDADMHSNIFSSLMMPSQTPATTILGTQQAAMAALRTLNIQEIREQLSLDIKERKLELKAADTMLREETLRQSEHNNENLGAAL